MADGPYDPDKALDHSPEYGWRDASNPRIEALERHYAKLDRWIEAIIARATVR